MELKDYLAALRRFWLTWVAATVVGVVVAGLILQLSTPTYEARAQVFVASSATGTSQIVGQRVKSYPDIAVSLAVLGPVMARLGIDSDVAEVRQRVRATNPVDTSQIVIVATSTSPEQAAELANAVAEDFTEVVEELERPAGGASSVTLTVTDPATPPAAPSTPSTVYVLGLGLVVGLLLGLALAIVRSRASTALHDEPAIRSAWGDDEALHVLTAPPGRGRRSALAGRPANSLARQLELMAEERPVRLLLLSPSPSPGARGAVEGFASEVVDELEVRGVSASTVGYRANLTEIDSTPDVRVRIEVGDPLAPLWVWRRIAQNCAGVVLVVPRGQVVAAELREMRTILRAAAIRPLAVVVTRPHGGRVPSLPGASSATPGSGTRPMGTLPPLAAPLDGGRGASAGTSTATPARPLIGTTDGTGKAR